MPTNRTAAHVAAIKACIAGCDCDSVACHGHTWDTAALTRCVEQIAAEAREEADALLARWLGCRESPGGAYPLTFLATDTRAHLSRAPVVPPPADAAVKESVTTDAASAALVAEIDRHRRDKHYLCSDCGPLHRRLVDALARLTAERDALRTACGEIADDAATIAVDMSRGIPDFCFDRSPSEGPLRIGRWLRATGECIGSLSRRLRALAGDAPPTGGTDVLA